MKVYVLEDGYDYEGRRASGVYADIESARAAAAEYEKGQNGFDSIYVTEFEIGAPADWIDVPCWEKRRGEEWKRY